MEETNSYRISIYCPPDREKLVADISFSNIQWAELNQEGAELRVEFYARPDGLPWNISLADAEGALKLAKQKLIG